MTVTDTAPATSLFAAALNPCICSQISVTFEEDTEPEHTACTSTTKGRFAPGHDAKLKGLLIKAGAADADVTVAAGGMLTHTSAENVAAEFGFAKQVAAGIAKARDFEAGRAEREAKAATAKTDRAIAKEAKAGERAEAKAKREADAEAKAAAKAEAKRLADEAKAAKAVAQPAPADGEVSAKVGRKVINGRVEDGVFVYADAEGNEVRTAKFQLLP